MNSLRHTLTMGSALLLAIALGGCAVPFLGARSQGVQSQLVAKATPATKSARVAKAKAARVSKSKNAAAALKETPVAVVEADDAGTWYRRAQRQFDADSAEAAEHSILVALERDRGYSPALALASKLDYEAGRHAESIERLAIVRTESTRFHDGERALLMAGLALHLDAVGQSAEAKEALASAPAAEERETGSARIYVLLRSDAPDEATELARRAVDRDGKSAVNLNNRGITQLRGGDIEAARKTFLQSIERDAKLPGPYYNLAILEKFYLLDDAAAATWYAAYRERSQADPDGLAEVFRGSALKSVATEGAGR